MVEAVGSEDRPWLNSGFAPQPDPSASGRRGRHPRPARIRCPEKPWPLSDGFSLAQREEVAASVRVLSPTATLDEAICRHVLAKDKGVRRHIRVEMARRYISGNDPGERRIQRDIFRFLIDVACNRLDLLPVERANIRSAFLKAAAHRVEPFRHERIVVQRTPGVVI